MRIGAVVAGIGWQIVQILGTYFVAHVLRGAPEAYGVFGLVLGLIAWIYLLALVIVFAAEVNVVGPEAAVAPGAADALHRSRAADLGRRARLHRIRRERAAQGVRSRRCRLRAAGRRGERRIRAQMSRCYAQVVRQRHAG